MFLELNREELSQLIRLVEDRVRKESMLDRERIHEGPHYSPVRDRDCWDRILHKLHECECDVLA